MAKTDQDYTLINFVDYLRVSSPPVVANVEEIINHMNQTVTFRFTLNPARDHRTYFWDYTVDRVNLINEFRWSRNSPSVQDIERLQRYGDRVIEEMCIANSITEGDMSRHVPDPPVHRPTQDGRVLPDGNNISWEPIPTLETCTNESLFRELKRRFEWGDIAPLIDHLIETAQVTNEEMPSA